MSGKGSRPAAEIGTVRSRLPVRVTAAVAATAVLGLGLTLRLVTGGAFAMYAGIALYAAFIYTLAVLLIPRARPAVVALVSLTFCWMVEFAQLTPLPAALSARGALVRLALGTTFNLPDLWWYVIGVLLAGAAHLISTALIARTDSFPANAHS